MASPGLAGKGAKTATTKGTDAPVKKAFMIPGWMWLVGFVLVYSGESSSCLLHATHGRQRTLGNSDEGRLSRARVLMEAQLTCRCSEQWGAVDAPEEGLPFHGESPFGHSTTGHSPHAQTRWLASSCCDRRATSCAWATSWGSPPSSRCSTRTSAPTRSSEAPPAGRDTLHRPPPVPCEGGNVML
jgi:hypothetical protein